MARTPVFLLALLAPASALAQATIELPPVAATAEDTDLELATVHFNAISLGGTHASSDPVTLTATNGTVELASLSGLSLSAGTGSGDTTVTFTGAAADINAALDGLLFTPTSAFAGVAALDVAVGGAANVTDSLRIAVNAEIDGEDARDDILLGVTSVHGGVQPGRMVAFGPEAYAVTWFPEGANEGPMFGAASWGSGRVIAVPDHQMLNMGSYGADSGSFYVNGIGWLADSAALDVAIVTLSQGSTDWLTSQGFTDVTTTDESGLSGALATADVLIAGWLGTSEPQANLDAIADFVTTGGGLFIADYGVGYDWWWGGPISDAIGNTLLREAGLGFSSGFSWDNGTIDATNRATGQVNASYLLDALLNGTAGLDPTELEAAAGLLERIYDALPTDDPLALELDAAFLSAISAITPTPATPVSDSFEQAMLLRELTILEALPLADVVEHRSAVGCFGTVGSAARVTETVAIDTAVTRWHSTGLYAAPGEIVTVTVPAAITGEGYVVRISGHVDNISGRGSWDRMPRVSRVFDLDATSVEIASPFGGALYIDIGTEPTAASFDVTIAEAVEAPHFVLGTTTDADWLTERDLPAPFAELESEHCTISLPSSMVDTVDDMEAVMTHWNQVVELQDALANHGALRTMAERINVDVQISVGLLHAGYPTQGPDWASTAIPDTETLDYTGSWGWYHELGHEAQRRPDKSWGWNNPYTFDGGVEATVNIFTSYAYDQIGQPSRGGWSWTGERIDVMKRALNALSTDTFASTGVGNKLAMFLQLRDGFGWPMWTDVFDEYNAASTQPADEQEERDTFLNRWSAIAGHDLSLFMVDHWGLQATPSAATLALPDWLPALGGVEGTFRTAPGESLTFDLQGEALSHDGVATLSVGAGLTDNGDGTWTYPGSAVETTETFTYTVTSSTGHTASHDLVIEVTWGGVQIERWLGLSGSAISDLTGAAAYPASPDEVEHVGSFAGPVNYDDSYGSRLSAYVQAPETGDYTFWIASDDGGEVWLDGALIGEVTGWTSLEDWFASPGQESAPIALQEGEIVFVEALHKEGGGSDHVTVAWEGPGVSFQVLGEPYAALDPAGFPEEPGDDDDSAGDDDDSAGDDDDATGDDDDATGDDDDATGDDDDATGDDDDSTSGDDDDSTSGDDDDMSGDDDDSTGLSDGGCDCEASIGGGGSPWLLLGLLAWRRRRA